MLLSLVENVNKRILEMQSKQGGTKGAHHTGAKSHGKERVVKFLSFKDREAVLANAKDHCPVGLYFNQDFFSHISKIRKDLWSELKLLWSQGKDVCISYNKNCYRCPAGNRGP